MLSICTIKDLSNLVRLVRIRLSLLLIVEHFLLILIRSILLLAWFPSLTLRLLLQVISIWINTVHILNIVRWFVVRVIRSCSHFANFDLIDVNLRR